MAEKDIEAIFVKIGVKLKDFEKGFDRIGAVLDQYEKNFKKIADKSSELSDKISNKLSDSMKKAGEAGKQAYDKVSASADKATTSTDKLKTETEKAGNVAKKAGNDYKSFNDQLNTMAKRTSDIGKGMSTKITLPVTVVGALGLKQYVDFEKQILRAKAVTQATTKEFEAMNKTAMELGATTEFSAGQAAEALGNLGQLGLSATNAIKVLPKTVDLATAGLIPLADAATITANAMNIMGLNVEEVSHLTDVLAVGASKTGASVQEIGTALVKVGPSAKATGQKLEDIVAAIGALRDVGVDASTVGTELRNVFVRLSGPTAGAQKRMAEFNIETKDARGNLKKLPDLIAEFAAKLEGLSGTQKLEILSEIFDVRTASVFLALMDAGAAKVQNLSNAMVGADGAVKRMADAIRGGLGGSLDELSSKIESSFIKTFDLIKGEIKKIIGVLIGLIDKFDRLPESVKKGAVAFAVFLAAIGPTLIALSLAIKSFMLVNSTLGLMSIATSTASKAFSLLSGGLPALLKGLGLMKGAIALTNAELYTSGAASIVAQGGFAKIYTQLGTLVSRFGLVGVAIALLAVVTIEVIGAWDDLNQVLFQGNDKWQVILATITLGLSEIIPWVYDLTKAWLENEKGYEKIGKAFRILAAIMTGGVSELVIFVVKKWKEIGAGFGMGVYNTVVFFLNLMTAQIEGMVNLAISAINKLSSYKIEPIDLKLEYMSFDEAMDKMDSVKNAAVDTAEDLVRIFHFKEIGAAAVETWEDIVGYFKIGGQAVVDVGKGSSDKFAENWERGLSRIKGMFDKYLVEPKSPEATPSGENPAQPEGEKPTENKFAGAYKAMEGYFSDLVATGQGAYQALAESENAMYDAKIALHTADLAREEEKRKKHEEELQMIRDKQTAWIGYGLSLADVFSSIQQASSSLFQQITSGFADSIAQIAVYGKSFKDTMAELWKSIAAAAIKALIMIGIQALLTAIMTKTATKSEGVSVIATKAGEAHAAGVASWSGAPWPINAGAPAFGAAMGAAAMLGMSYLGAAESGGIVSKHGFVEVGEKNKREAIIPLEGSEALGGARNQTIVVELDNRVLMETIVRGMPEHIRLKTGSHI